MRLNQFLASNLGITRKQADVLIAQNTVKINGQLATIGVRVGETDEVEYSQKGSWKKLIQTKITKTILYYKPIFTVSARKDEDDRKTVYDLLPKVYEHLTLFDKLDYMSEGLLVLSSDENIMQTLEKPGQKVYLIGFKTGLRNDVVQELKKNAENLEITEIITFEDSDLDRFSYLKLQPHFVWYMFVIKRGSDGLIRKICFKHEQKVLRLVCVKYGEFEMNKELYVQKIIEA
jgi:23S rRNA pseudouridine2605 synthase